MRDLKLIEAGCEPRRGPAALAVLLRRALRKALRPVLDRLAELLSDLSDRLDAAEARAGAAEARADHAHSRADDLHRRTSHSEGRLDEAERRLDGAEWSGEVLASRLDGLTTHANGLTEEHHALAGRVARLTAETIPGIDERHRAIEDRLKAFEALHWDHVALTRRLAAIEDALAGLPDLARPAAEGAEAGPSPSIPFPGFEGDARARVG